MSTHLPREVKPRSAHTIAARSRSESQPKRKRDDEGVEDDSEYYNDDPDQFRGSQMDRDEEDDISDCSDYYADDSIHELLTDDEPYDISIDLGFLDEDEIIYDDEGLIKEKINLPELSPPKDRKRKREESFDEDSTRSGKIYRRYDAPRVPRDPKVPSSLCLKSPDFSTISVFNPWKFLNVIPVEGHPGEFRLAPSLGISDIYLPRVVKKSKEHFTKFETTIYSNKLPFRKRKCFRCIPTGVSRVEAKNLGITSETCLWSSKPKFQSRRIVLAHRAFCARIYRSSLLSSSSFGWIPFSVPRTGSSDLFCFALSIALSWRWNQDPCYGVDTKRTQTIKASLWQRNSYLTFPKKKLRLFNPFLWRKIPKWIIAAGSTRVFDSSSCKPIKGWYPGYDNRQNLVKLAKLKKCHFSSLINYVHSDLRVRKSIPYSQEEERFTWPISASELKAFLKADTSVEPQLEKPKPLKQIISVVSVSCQVNLGTIVTDAPKPQKEWCPNIHLELNRQSNEFEIVQISRPRSSRQPGTCALHSLLNLSSEESQHSEDSLDSSIIIYDPETGTYHENAEVKKSIPVFKGLLNMCTFSALGLDENEVTSDYVTKSEEESPDVVASTSSSATSQKVTIEPIKEKEIEDNQQLEVKATTDSSTLAQAPAIKTTVVSDQESSKLQIPEHSSTEAELPIEPFEPNEPDFPVEAESVPSGESPKIMTPKWIRKKNSRVARKAKNKKSGKSNAQVQKPIQPTQTTVAPPAPRLNENQNEVQVQGENTPNPTKTDIVQKQSNAEVPTVDASIQTAPPKSKPSGKSNAVLKKQSESLEPKTNTTFTTSSEPEPRTSVEPTDDFIGITFKDCNCGGRPCRQALNNRKTSVLKNLLDICSLENFEYKDDKIVKVSETKAQPQKSNIQTNDHSQPEPAASVIKDSAKVQQVVEIKSNTTTNGAKKTNATMTFVETEEYVATFEFTRKVQPSTSSSPSSSVDVKHELKFNLSGAELKALATTASCPVTPEELKSKGVDLDPSKLVGRTMGEVKEMFKSQLKDSSVDLTVTSIATTKVSTPSFSGSIPDMMDVKVALQHHNRCFRSGFKCKPEKPESVLGTLVNVCSPPFLGFDMEAKLPKKIPELKWEPKVIRTDRTILVAKRTSPKTAAKEPEVKPSELLQAIHKISAENSSVPSQLMDNSCDRCGGRGDVPETTMSDEKPVYDLENEAVVIEVGNSELDESHFKKTDSKISSIEALPAPPSEYLSFSPAIESEITKVAERVKSCAGIIEHPEEPCASKAILDVVIATKSASETMVKEKESEAKEPNQKDVLFDAYGEADSKEVKTEAPPTPSRSYFREVLHSITSKLSLGESRTSLTTSTSTPIKAPSQQPPEPPEQEETTIGIGTQSADTSPEATLDCVGCRKRKPKKPSSPRRDPSPSPAVASTSALTSEELPPAPVPAARSSSFLDYLFGRKR